MGREAGPDISVSTSGFYITGNSSDATSGVAKYCYNTSDTPGSYTDVPTITVGAYSVPQYHVTASGTYRCHVLDTAGNHNFDTTEEITFYTYHCNYCGQDTNDLTNHYRCPTHYASQLCSTYSTCSVGSECLYTIPQLSAINLYACGVVYSCCLCGAQFPEDSESWGVATTESVTCLVGHLVLPNRVDQRKNWYYWCQYHGSSPRCLYKNECGKGYKTNTSIN